MVLGSSPVVVSSPSDFVFDLHYVFRLYFDYFVVFLSFNENLLTISIIFASYSNAFSKVVINYF